MAIPVQWHPKDPDEEIIYELLWADSLIEGDTVTGSVWSDIVGVSNEDESISPDGLSTRILLSGGVDGTTASLTNTVTTALGETREQIVILPIIAGVVDPEAVPPYTLPTAGDLVARYPAFRDVPYSTVSVHINDAQTGVDTTWTETTYRPGIMALAAHNMAVLGIGAHGESTEYARQGVTSLRDGSFSVSFDAGRVKDTVAGKLSSTQYGAYYLTLLRRNKAGPRLVGGPLPNDGWGPLAQQNNGGILPWSGF